MLDESRSSEIRIAHAIHADDPSGTVLLARLAEERLEVERFGARTAIASELIPRARRRRPRRAARARPAAHLARADAGRGGGDRGDRERARPARAGRARGARRAVLYTRSCSAPSGGSRSRSSARCCRRRCRRCRGSSSRRATCRAPAARTSAATSISGTRSRTVGCCCVIGDVMAYGPRPPRGWVSCARCSPPTPTTATRSTGCSPISARAPAPLDLPMVIRAGGRSSTCSYGGDVALAGDSRAPAPARAEPRSWPPPGPAARHRRDGVRAGRGRGARGRHGGPLHGRADRGPRALDRRRPRAAAGVIARCRRGARGACATTCLARSGARPAARTTSRCWSCGRSPVFQSCRALGWSQPQRATAVDAGAPRGPAGDGGSGPRAGARDGSGTGSSSGSARLALDLDPPARGLRPDVPFAAAGACDRAGDGRGERDETVGRPGDDRGRRDAVDLPPAQGGGFALAPPPVVGEGGAPVLLGVDPRAVQARGRRSGR